MNNKLKKKVLNAGYVELIEWMGNDSSVIRNARLCWRSEDKSNERSNKNLLKHLIKKEHKTPFEAITFSFNVKAPIFVARQWFRHRMCLSGDSVITFVNTNGDTTPKLQYKLKDLYEQWMYGETCTNSATKEQIEGIDKLRNQGYSIRKACKKIGIGRNTYNLRKKKGNFGKRCSKKRLSNMNLRVLDESNNRFIVGHIEDIMYSGDKLVYEVTTESGHKLKSTLDHKYFTDQGWLSLREAYKVGAKLAVSGYSHLEYRKIKKRTNVNYKEEWKPINGFEGRYDISNYGRVRSWVDTQNNILDKPKMKKITTNNFGRSIVGLWRDGKGKYDQVSRLVAEHFIPNPKNEPYVCHRDDDPQNNYVSNLYWGNEETNQRDKARFAGTNSSFVEFSKIVSLIEIGIEPTYDVSVNAEFHNFVANGFVVHNSSFNEESLRYCVAKREYFIPEELIDEFDQKRWCQWNEEQFDAYDYFVERGLSKEQARSLLPLGIYTTYYWTVNGSSLMNFLKLRMDSAAQKEIRVYADAILEIVKEVAPVTFNTFEEMILLK